MSTYTLTLDILNRASAFIRAEYIEGRWYVGRSNGRYVDDYSEESQLDILWAVAREIERNSQYLFQRESYAGGWSIWAQAVTYAINNLRLYDNELNALIECIGNVLTKMEETNG